MRKVLSVFLTTVALAAAADQTFIGTITDSMCGKNHAAMNMGADPKCTIACVKSGEKYVLNDGQKSLRLSNQQLPEKFAGQKVTVTGTLNEKSGTIKVTTIEAAK